MLSDIYYAQDSKGFAVVELDLRKPNDRELLVTTWFRHAEDISSDKYVWAAEIVFSMLDENPPLAYTLILELIHRAPSQGALGLACASHFEDLLTAHGEALVERLEADAARDPLLRQALPGVWLTPERFSLPVLKRFEDLDILIRRPREG